MYGFCPFWNNQLLFSNLFWPVANSMKYSSKRKALTPKLLQDRSTIFWEQGESSWQVLFSRLHRPRWAPGHSAAPPPAWAPAWSRVCSSPGAPGHTPPQGSQPGQPGPWCGTVGGPVVGLVDIKIYYKIITPPLVHNPLEHKALLEPSHTQCLSRTLSLLSGQLDIFEPAMIHKVSVMEDL